MHLTLPRILARLPYGAKPNLLHALITKKVLMEAIMLNFVGLMQPMPWAPKLFAFSLYHWTASIRGVEGGGLVEQLQPTPTKPAKATYSQMPNRNCHNRQA